MLVAQWVAPSLRTEIRHKYTGDIYQYLPRLIVYLLRSIQKCLLERPDPLNLSDEPKVFPSDHFGLLTECIHP